MVMIFIIHYLFIIIIIVEFLKFIIILFIRFSIKGGLNYFEVNFKRSLNLIYFIQHYITLNLFWEIQLMFIYTSK